MGCTFQLASITIFKQQLLILSHLYFLFNVAINLFPKDVVRVTRFERTAASGAYAALAACGHYYIARGR